MAEAAAAAAAVTEAAGAAAAAAGRRVEDERGHQSFPWYNTETAENGNRCRFLVDFALVLTPRRWVTPGRPSWNQPR